MQVFREDKMFKNFRARILTRVHSHKDSQQINLRESSSCKLSKFSAKLNGGESKDTRKLLSRIIQMDSRSSLWDSTPGTSNQFIFEVFEHLMLELECLYLLHWADSYFSFSWVLYRISFCNAILHIVYAVTSIQGICLFCYTVSWADCLMNLSIVKIVDESDIFFL